MSTKKWSGHYGRRSEPVISRWVCWGLTLLLSKLLFKSLTEVLTAFGLTLLVFGPYAWFSLVAVTRIYRAEKLVQNQSKHTQSIVLGRSNNFIERTSPAKPGLATHVKR